MEYVTALFFFASVRSCLKEKNMYYENVWDLLFFVFFCNALEIFFVFFAEISFLKNY